MTDTAPRGPVQIEGHTNIDGEPLFGWHWSEPHGGPHEPEGLPDPCVSRTTLNRNIDGLPAVKLEADR